MDSTTVLYLGRYTLETALLLSAPILIACTLVGVIVSILQAVTSIRDTTISTVPKLAAVGVTVLLFGGWMLELTLKFTTDVFGFIAKAGHF
jgi:flagellar biosynthetic protein FliQ